MFILLGDTSKQFDLLLNIFSEDCFSAATGSHSSTSIAFLKTSQCSEYYALKLYGHLGGSDTWVLRKPVIDREQGWARMNKDEQETNKRSKGTKNGDWSKRQIYKTKTPFTWIELWLFSLAIRSSALISRHKQKLPADCSKLPATRMAYLWSDPTLHTLHRCQLFHSFHRRCRHSRPCHMLQCPLHRYIVPDPVPLLGWALREYILASSFGLQSWKSYS